MIITGTEPVGTGEHATKPLAPNEAPPKSRIMGGFGRTAFLTPDQARTKFGGETVGMIFPHEVYLTTQERDIINFPAGRHEVPEELADHPYLRANGVERLIAAPVRELQPVLAGKEKKTAPLEK
jgi:hypothetical protein